MPVYEYQGQFYELSETDPVAAKKKIIASVGGPAPEGGFFPALRAGATELGGGISALMGRVGLKDVAQAQQEYEAAKQKAAEIFQGTEEGWTESPWTKFKETLGGSLPYMAAPLAAGAAAATLPVTGPAAVATTLGAAGLASAGQFTATNIARQLEEEKKRTGAYDLAGTDIQSAALAAIPQAALDTLALRFMPGVGKLLGDAGIQVTKESAKQVSEQILKKAVTDYAVTTGKAVGREGLTEAAQQVFERLQAGLNIADPDARREYVESFIGGAVLGGALAPAGRYVERGTAARQVAGIEQEEALQQRQAARAAEEAKRKDPAYALQLDADYQAAVEKMKELQAAVPKRPGKDALPEEQMAFEQAKAARDAHLRDVLRPLTAEYSPRKAEIAQLKERQRIEGMSPEEYMLEGLGVKPTAEVAPAAEPATIEEAALQAQAAATAPAAPQLSPVDQYAKERIDLANEQQSGTADVTDYTDYLLTDPQMAAQLVATNAKLPGLNRKDNAAVLGGLKLKLAEQSKEQAAALAESRPDLAPPATETPDPLALWKASLEQSDEQTKEELLGLDFERAFGKDAAPVVATPEQIKPIQNPTALLKQIDSLVSARDAADRDTTNAFGAGNKELGAKKAQEREAAQTALSAVEQDEGPGRAIVSLRKAQDTALMNVAQLTDDLRVGRTLGGPEAETASSTPKTLVNQINRERDNFIKTAVQEAAVTRRLFGRSLTQDEANVAAKKMRGVFDEWVTRSMAQPLKAVNWLDKMTAYFTAEEALGDQYAVDQPFVKAQRDAFVKSQLSNALVERLGSQRMAEIAKGTAELKGAETALSADERRSISAQATKEFNSIVLKAQKEALAQSTDPRPLEERRFGAYRAATEVLQDQLRKISSQLVSLPKGSVTREEALIRRQVAGAEAAKVAEASGETAQTLEGQLRRRRDYVGGLIDQAFQTRRVPGIAETLLTRAQDFITAAPNTFLDAAENIASRILRGQNIERTDLVELRDELRAASARPGEAEVAGERVGQRELFPAEERRALAPKQERGALGLIREKPEAFEVVRAKEAAKAKRANEAIQKSEKLTQDIKAALAQLDKDRQAELAKQVEESEASLQSAWQSAVKKAKAMVVAARRAAQKPKIDSLKAEIDAIRKGGVTGLNKETLDRLFAARKALEDIDAEINEAVDAAEFLPNTAANKWVAFAKGRVEQAKAALAAAKTPQNAQALNQQEQALRQAEQARLQSLKGEEKAAEAARMRAAQGQIRDVAGQELPGRRRVAGKVEEIKPEVTAQERAEAEAERREQTREEIEARVQEREAKQTELEQRVLDLGTQVAELEAAQKRARSPESKAKLQTQIDTLTKEARIAQGKLDAFGEAKPRKKGPATVVSGAGLAKQRPLRTGYRKALEAASEGVRREREETVELPGVFEFGPQDKLFSRGTTESPSTIDSVRTELKKTFPDLGRVQLYDSVDALIKANPQYEGKIPSDARGFVDTAGNKAFLIAENIEQGQALSVLLHEVGTHIGMKNMLGDAQYNALVNAVKSWEKKTDGSVEARVAKAARSRVEAAETKPSQVNDELLAYAVEEAVNAGVKPAETKGVLGQWLSQIASLFRRALERFGLPPKAMDTQGLVDLAFGAAQIEMRPAVPQMSRRQFLRGAGAALGGLKLPPLSKEMNLRALRSVFEGSLDARAAWFDALKAAAKTNGLGKVIGQYEDLYEGDNPLVAFTQSDALQDFLYNTTYNENYQGDGYDYYLNELLSGKDGVKVVADLQQALRAQAANLVEAAQKLAKDKGLPEVGELFFSGTEKPSAFKRWFGDSKVVDENGDPLVVYHGTAEDFTTFDRTKATDGRFGAGFYFGRADKASRWAGKAGPEAGLVMPVYLNISNPAPESVWRPLREKMFAGKITGEEMRSGLESQGYDGVIHSVLGRPKEFVAFRPEQIKSAIGNRGTYDPTNPNILFSRNLPTAARVADQIIGKQPTAFDSFKKNMFGLAFRTQVIDALAPLEKIANTAMDALKGTQMMYYLRMYGMRNNMVAEAISNGVVQLKQIERADGEKEWVLESEKGVNIKDMVKRLAQKDVVKEAGSPDAANRLFTLYMAALRGERVGYNKLSFGRAAAEAELREVERELASPSLTPEDKPRLLQRKEYLEKNIDSLPTEADFKAAKAEIESNDTLKSAFEEVREMYNEYNANLLKLLVDTGAMSKELAERLLKDKDYIPYYRMRGGNAQLMIGGETPIRVGNIKDSPHLQELVGGEEPIFNFLDSSVQNTSMLLDMALRNVAAKNVAYELADVGLASKPVKTSKAGAPRGSLEFKKDGDDYYVVVNTDHVGVPSDLLVKGMAGIPTMLPVGIRLLGIPARVLRRAVTSTPIFAAKQLFRDSTAAFLVSGTNSVPLLGALRKLGKTSPLEARGITGGQTFTGMPEDVSRLLREMQEGRPGWSKAFAKMEALSIEADAATRRAQYESYRAQGLSEMEATLMALESMNFSKRGLSPTMHMASTLVPFLNSQLQGLDVLYKSLTGKMPFNEKLDIQRKLFTRGALMFMGTMAYAAAMQDDEEYKNAPPDVKYGNWFVRVPFLDQYAGEPVTVRVPIPFEIGYIFKALPEMLYNSMQSEAGAKDALKALNHILIQMVPGGSSMVPIQIGDAKIPAPVIIPAAMKPIIEVGLGKSFFTGRDLESAREQREVPGMRYRPGTSEIAKYIGEATNFSPIKIEALVSGYTGGLGLAMLQALSLPLPKAATEVPEKRWSELPLVGSTFQPSDAPGIVNDVYERLQKVTQAADTYKSLVDRGELGKAQAFLQGKLPLLALESIAGDYRKDMGDLTKDERLIRGAPSLTAEEKAKLLAQIRKTKIQIASQVRVLLERSSEEAERRVPQSALA